MEPQEDYSLYRASVLMQKYGIKLDEARALKAGKPAKEKKSKKPSKEGD